MNVPRPTIVIAAATKRMQHSCVIIRLTILSLQSWLGLSEQDSRVDKWNVCRVQAAAICGSQLK